jgi:hypothetical protein
LCIYKK